VLRKSRAPKSPICSGLQGIAAKWFRAAFLRFFRDYVCIG
jgi:hypothetical protein